MTAADTALGPVCQGAVGKGHGGARAQGAAFVVGNAYVVGAATVVGTTFVAGAAGVAWALPARLPRLVGGSSGAAGVVRAAAASAARCREAMLLSMFGMIGKSHKQARGVKC